MFKYSRMGTRNYATEYHTYITDGIERGFISHEPLDFSDRSYRVYITKEKNVAERVATCPTLTAAKLALRVFIRRTHEN